MATKQKEKESQSHFKSLVEFPYKICSKMLKIEEIVYLLKALMFKGRQRTQSSVRLDRIEFADI